VHDVNLYLIIIVTQGDGFRKKNILQKIKGIYIAYIKTRFVAQRQHSVLRL